MPTLIVEDGTGVANANTYIDESFLLAYASDRGFSAPSTVEVQQQYILIAMDYLSWYTDVFQGTRKDSGNALPWPRQNVYLDCNLVADTVIPDKLKFAQAQLVIEQQKQTPLFPAPRTSSVEGLVTEETLGPLTTKYAFTGEGIANAYTPIEIMSVKVFLSQLLESQATGFKVSRA